ncbi:maltokinase N-terminal cap-like domain-containing protein [Nocardia sp. NBC_01329]|uniref:maltokinase N-terminal cap-like domain-containing protein n=1 Tax=Nocardia sp. NBC_01329 TaxID=2903594 RepID=UPI002E123E7B|nr:1,4-alpha-glucan branching protein [Nocardia sp. NBC_01329]
MAVIHRTTMEPTKIELLGRWLPSRPWYSGPGRAESLRRVGGFRLDDPTGAVGIEMLVVTDIGSAEPITYFVPLSYRDAELETEADALLDTAEHGVLGTRWIYDGARDPVAVDRMVALLAGGAQAQHGTDSDTPDMGVLVAAADLPADGSALVSAAENPAGTDITVTGGQLRVHRVLGRSEPVLRTGQVVVPWTAPDGSTVRSVVLSELR